MRTSSLLLVASLVLLPPPALAQRSTASIRGTVRDATQAILPGATVTVRNEETGLTRTTVTNHAGLYSASELP